MIESTNIFVSTVPPKKASMPTNSASRSEDVHTDEPAAEGDAPVKTRSEKPSRDVEHVENTNPNSGNKAKKKQGEAVGLHEDTKSRDKKSKGKDESEFQLLIDEAMTQGLVEEIPEEAIAEGLVIPGFVPVMEGVELTDVVEGAELVEIAELADATTSEMLSPIPVDVTAFVTNVAEIANVADVTGVVSAPQTEVESQAAVAMNTVVAATPNTTVDVSMPELPTAGAVISAPVVEPMVDPSAEPLVLEEAIVPPAAQGQAIETKAAEGTNTKPAVEMKSAKPVVVMPESPVLPTDTKQEPSLPPEHTSGRPESSLPKANVPQVETPRTHVEASAPSSDAKTAAPETSPKSAETNSTTPGRPVVYSSAVETPSTSVSEPVSQPAVKADFTAVMEQKQSDAQSSQGDSSSQTPSKQAPREANVQSPEASTFAQAWQGAPNPYAAGSQPARPVQEQKGVEVVASVTEAAPVTTDGTSTSDAEELFKTLDNFAPGSTSTTTSTSAVTTAGASAATGAKVADQITTHIQANRTTLGEEMVIRLDPPELGRIRIQIRSMNGELTGVIRADNRQTLVELQRESSSLMQRLNDAGVQIKTLDMGMSDMSQQGRNEQSFSQAQNTYSMFQQNQGGGRGYGYQHGGANETNENYQNDSQAHNAQNEQLITDSAVNVML